MICPLARECMNSFSIDSRLLDMPAVAILGPSQCGKSTLAKRCLIQRQETLYLDLERPRDRNKLLGAEGFLTINCIKLICLDEVLRVPELFPLLRGLIDEQ